MLWSRSRQKWQKEVKEKGKPHCYRLDGNREGTGMLRIAKLRDCGVLTEG